MAIATRRDSRYKALVRQCLSDGSHPTNQEIIQFCRRKFPSVSATTIHRITKQMLVDGEISLAPPDRRLSMRFDSNLLPHGHFECDKCGKLRDLTVPRGVMQLVQEKHESLIFNGEFLLKGWCKDC